MFPLDNSRKGTAEYCEKFPHRSIGGARMGSSVLRTDKFFFGVSSLDAVSVVFDDNFMLSKSRTRLYGAFYLNAVIGASIIMFGCMAAGEIIYDRNLFRGFLGEPSLWVGIFMETSIATMFMTVIGSLILYWFRSLRKDVFARVSAVVWCSLGLILIALYSHFYWTREWHLTAIAPGLVFGWILPGLLSIIYFVSLSLKLRQPTRD